MRAAADLPDAFDAMGHDVVVGPAQRAIGAKAHEGRQHQCRRVALTSMEADSQQRDLTPAVSEPTARAFLRFVQISDVVCGHGNFLRER